MLPKTPGLIGSFRGFRILPGKFHENEGVMCVQ